VRDLAPMSPKLHCLTRSPRRARSVAVLPAALATDGGLLDAVSCAMTADPPQVTGPTSIAALRSMLVDLALGAVVVVDGDHRPRGIVSKTELFGAAIDECATAGDLMSGLLFWLRVDAPVAQAAALMAYEGIEHVVVVSPEGRLAGLVTALDVARICARDTGYLPGHRLGRAAAPAATAILERRLLLRAGE